MAKCFTPFAVYFGVTNDYLFGQTRPTRMLIYNTRKYSKCTFSNRTIIDYTHYQLIENRIDV